MMSEVMFTPGRYYIGDMCYLDDMLWQDACNSHIGKVSQLEDGRKFIMFHTKWGDGEYYDREDHFYWVDSGTIGIVPYKGESRTGARIVEFKQPFYVSQEDGVLIFGHIEIDTDPECYDEDETEENFYEE